jgi:hypothetical protein
MILFQQIAEMLESGVIQKPISNVMWETIMPKHKCRKNNAENNTSNVEKNNAETRKRCGKTE